MKPAPKPRPTSVPRHGLFVVVRSGARTAQIGRSAVILRKPPSIFRKSPRAPEALSKYFAKNTSYYSQINPQSRTASRLFANPLGGRPVPSPAPARLPPPAAPSSPAPPPFSPAGTKARVEHGAGASPSSRCSIVSCTSSLLPRRH